MIGKLILSCFHARTNAHVLHLSTRSYAQHVALQDFYDALLGLTDSLAEAYQGDYGLIKFSQVPYIMATDPLDVLDSLRETVDECAKKDWDAEDTYLNNICDEIRALICQTQYKLRFLR